MKRAQSCEPSNTVPQCIAPAESNFAHLCALDCWISRSFKHGFKHFLSLNPTVTTDKDVSGLVKKGWDKGLELTIDPVSGKSTSTAILAFARVGLVPFTCACVDKLHFSPTDLYKSKSAAAAPPIAGRKRKVAAVEPAKAAVPRCLQPRLSPSRSPRKCRPAGVSS